MTNGVDGQRWAKELVDRIGKAIKEARGGKSAAWLSDRTAELGYRVSPTVIAKLDSGHRGTVLSVAELLVLSAALGVPPVALVYPGPYGQPVEVLPNEETTEIAAAEWFSGLEFWRSELRGSPEDDPDAVEWFKWHIADSRLPLWRMLRSAESRRLRLLALGDPKRDREQIESYDDQIHRLRAQLGIDPNA